MTRAIVYVPAGEFDPHAARCLAYCEAQGYEFRGIIRGDWKAVEEMMGNGETSVVLVSTEEHLPPNRKPRIEVVANEQVSPGVRRTRMLRRNAGA